MIRSIISHHLSAIACKIISRTKTASIIYIPQHVFIFRSLPGQILTSWQIFIPQLTVYIGSSCHILWLLHSSLYLKRIYPCIDQSTYIRKHTHIFKTEHVCALIFQLISLPTWLGAASPVATSAAGITAHKASTGVTITHRPVNKCLYLNINLTLYWSYFIQW